MILQNIFVRTFILLILFHLLPGCGRSQDSLLFQPLSFQVNPSLVDSLWVIEQHNLVFKTPRGFISLPDSIIANAKASLSGKQEGNLPGFIPENAWINPQMPTAVIFISSLKIDTSEDTAFVRFVKSYNVEYQSTFPGAETFTFMLNDIRCWQGRKIEKSKIHFRLLLDRGSIASICQLDLSFPINEETDTGRIIESVLGSIHIHK